LSVRAGRRWRLLLWLAIALSWPVMLPLAGAPSPPLGLAALALVHRRAI